MEERIPAIYEEGVLKPLEPLNLEEHQRVYLSIEPGEEPPPPSLDEIQDKLRAALPEFTQRFAVQSLGIFGSYARGTQRAGSDLDILVTFYESPGFLTFIQVEQELAECVGVRVDLVTPNALKPALREAILAEVVLLSA